MFTSHIIEFNETILGLRDFVDFLEPILNDRLEENKEKITPILLSGITKYRLQDETTKLDEQKKTKLENLKREVDEKLLKIYNSPVEVSIENLNLEDGKVSFDNLTISSKSKIDAFDSVEKSARHIESLYKNSFISLISSVEWFFSQILHYYYNQFPDAASIKDKVLTLEQLKSFGSIEDAEKYLIDKKIEETIRASFDKWIKFLNETVKLKLGYLKPYKDELIEIYERRNLLVHNGGVVNSIYLSNVNEKIRTGIETGQKITVDKEYLDDSIRKLHLVFILIASELWKQLANADTTRGDVLTNIIYENLLKERWDIAEGLSYFVIKDEFSDPITKTISQLNHWLCKKRKGEIEHIKKELDEANFDDKRELYQLGLFSLREDKENFFRVLPQALDAKQLNASSLEEFPIFAEMRAVDEYQKFKEESDHFKENS